MKIMNKVTWEYLKRNRRRTVVTILGVIISVAMIAAVSTFFGTFMDLMRRDAIDRDGEWHMRFLSVSLEDTATVTEHDNTAEAVLSRQLGWGKLDTVSDEDALNRSEMQFLNVQEYSPEAFPFRSVRLSEGRYPQTPDEILVADTFHEALGREIALGDTITVPVGQRVMLDDENNPVVFTSNASYYTQEGESFQNAVTRTYTVVGIIPTGAYTSRHVAMEVYSLLDVSALAPSDAVDVTVRARSTPGDIFDSVNSFAETFPNNGVEFNDSLLRTMGLLNDSQLTSTFLVLILIVGSIIMVGSVMLIYNSFAISVSERSRQLGMLASVGATRQQKRNSVFFEGAVIGAVAIPLGILFGILGIGITYILIDPMIREVLNIQVPMRVKADWTAVLAAVAVSAATILISLWIPAKRASRITPIEAIRQSQDVKLKGKQVKTSRLMRRLFGFEGELALKNLKRNKRRYRATVLSLTVSILLFLTAASFTHFIGKSYDMTREEYTYDIYTNIQRDFEQESGVIQQISQLDGVKNLMAARQLGSNNVALPGELLTEQTRSMLQPGDDGLYLFNVGIYAMDSATLEAYAKAAGATMEALLDVEHPQAILQNNVTFKTKHEYTDLQLLNAKPGETLPVYTDDYDENGEVSKRWELPVELAAVTSEVPLLQGKITAVLNQLSLFVSEPVLDKLKEQGYANSPDAGQEYMLAIESTGNPDQLEKDINKLLSQYSGTRYGVFNLTAGLHQQAQLGNIMAVFIYGFVALITLIAVANTFNTISTSIGLRRREFAMLKSVGMTPKGFNRMINYESIFYGVKSLLFGLPLSFIVMLLEYKSLQENFDFQFSLPWGAILGVVVAIFLIVGSTMLYSISKVKKANIIDALTEENI